jgi:hypothetical protein
MSEIKMSYVFIDNNNTLVTNKTIEDLIYELLDKNSFERDEGKIYLEIDDKNGVEYKVKTNKYDDRCRVELLSRKRLNYALKDLKMLDNSIMKTDMQRYFCVIRDYDGISECYCQRLYPKYAKFERSLRQLILLVLTKAFGATWKDQTIDKEKQNELKKKNRGNINLSNILEQMDLNELEDYLFKKREADYEYYFNEVLTVEKLKNMDKDTICNLIEKMRPKSLWERNFQSIGKQSEWESEIKAVHDVRNQVAHHKNITEKEYTTTVKNINALNRKLVNSIDSIETKYFDENTYIDVLESFKLLAQKFSQIWKQYDFSALMTSINSALFELSKSLKQVCSQETISALQATTSMLSKSLISEELKDVSSRINAVSLNYIGMKQDDEKIL